MSRARGAGLWTARLPKAARRTPTRILLAGAAAGGAELADLAGLVEDERRRCAVPDGDDGGGFAVSVAAAGADVCMARGRGGRADP